MTTGNVPDETRLYFTVVSDEYAIENGIVADPESVDLSEKVFVQSRLRATNNVDSTLKNVNSEWTQVNDTNYPTLSAGFLADLKKIYDADRTTLGLDPV